jgi:enoyl-CoA hydratase
VILTGSGRAFSAGVDLSVAAESLFSPASGSPVVSKGFDPENDLVALCRALPFPIIAAINGACYTGGLELALACDVLIAADDAQFCDTHAKFGIAPSWGMSQRLPRLIGTHRALEMSFSALPIGAQQAALWGLVNRVVPAQSLLAECAALARHMLANQPRLVTLYKQLVHEGSLMPLGAASTMERDRAAAYYATMTPQQFAAMKAFVSRGREGKASPPAKSKL